MSDLWDSMQGSQELSVQTDAAHVYCDHVVALGVAEKVLWAAGSHNDVAARDCGFYLIDAIKGTTTALDTAVARAASVLHQLYEGVKVPECLVLRYGHTLRFYIPALAGGKTATLAMYIEKIKGEDQFNA
jgi:hypothetical protein